ncbi:MAG TPA: O-antigen ligase family protein [bacterium]|nr:O-antigen ligase family protein [bacterium]HPG44184.1 O-antigen ligase family protein [bacterium]HPM96551.1 O-antigen ligase family protein [bacterium]
MKNQPSIVRPQLDRHLQQILEVSLLVFAAAMPFSIALTQIAIGCAILCWFARIAITRSQSFQPIGLEIPFLLFIGAAFLSLFFSTNAAQSAIFMKRHLLVLVFYVIAQQVQSKSLMQKLAWIFIAAMAVYSLFGILSFLQDPTVRVRHVQNSMTAGGLTMMGAVISLALLITHKRRKVQIALLLALLLNFICLILTSTRGSWLGFFSGALLVIYLQNRKLLLAIPVLLVLLLLVQPETLAHRTRHFFDPTWRTNAKRISWWKTGWEIYKDHPLTGIGDVSTQTVYQQYAGPDIEESIGHFHNNFIHIAVTLGSIGLAAFVNLLGFLFYRVWQVFRRCDRSAGLAMARGWTLAAMAVWTGFVINGLFEWNFGDQEIVTALYFVCGLALALPTRLCAATFAAHRAAQSDHGSNAQRFQDG